MLAHFVQRATWQDFLIVCNILLRLKSDTLIEPIKQQLMILISPTLLFTTDYTKILQRNAITNKRACLEKEFLGASKLFPDPSFPSPSPSPWLGHLLLFVLFLLFLSQTIEPTSQAKMLCYILSLRLRSDIQTRSSIIEPFNASPRFAGCAIFFMGSIMGT